MDWRNANLAPRFACAAALALAAWAAGAYPALFMLERTAVANGELWRLWTGHLVHGNAAHYAYDVGAAALLCLVFRPSMRLLWFAPLISILLLVALPELQHYYGLSALLHAWVVALAVDLCVEERGARSYFAGLIVLSVFTKALIETTLGASLFTADLDFGGPVLYASHLVGAMVAVPSRMANPRFLDSSRLKSRSC